MNRVLIGLVAATLVTGAVGAAPAGSDLAVIAVLESSTGSPYMYINRLAAIGHAVDLIPVDSGFDVLARYGLIIMPVNHANFSYDVLDALATDYHAYVHAGGGLWLGQPNPLAQPDDPAVITWVPYHLALSSSYDSDDCPAQIVDGGHCVTEGLAADDFSYPIDWAVEVASEWDVLLVGGETGRPATLFAEYGAGRVLIDLGNPIAGTSDCNPSDAALARFVECTIASPVATEGATWSDLRARFL